MGEHYNSVRRIDDPCLKGESPLTAYPIGHDLSKLKDKLGKVKVAVKPETSEAKSEEEDSSEILSLAFKEAGIEGEEKEEATMRTVLQEMFLDKYKALEAIPFAKIISKKKQIAKKYDEVLLRKFEELTIEDSGKDKNLVEEEKKEEADLD